ncbi:MAG: protein phosphatase 2C domain-containing protein, partial [Lachnospiraceae bacterium]|nr:protein phosphatase 2C domain-containing protein [Lachnospiraceae bacterium]
CLYEKGQRESNQDSIALHKIVTLYGEAVLAVVCDGMGGMDEGETASGYVAERMSCWFYEELPPLLERRVGMKGIARSVERKLFHMHINLKEYGKRKKIVTGTTVSILLVTDKKYLICHLGDSAIYRIDRKRVCYRRICAFSDGDFGRRVRRMTGIHGDAASGLERCIGSGKYYPPDIMRGRLRKHMAFLVSSDGFWHHLKEEEIGNTFQAEYVEDTGWAEKRLRALAAKAIRRGETDNISAIYLE